VKTTKVAVAGLMLALLASCGDDGGKAGSAGSFCDAARNAKGSADAQQELFSLDESPTPDKVQPAIEDFAAKFAAMSSAAPSEIKADVDTINQAAQQLLDVVKRNGFDVVAMISKPEFTALSDTFSSTEYQAAQGRFQDYIDTNCGITDTTDITDISSPQGT
jgi:BMFP domain-containing protein YqiC